MFGRVFLVLIHVLLARLTSSASLNDMYPFGQQYGHQELHKNDDQSSPEIFFRVPFQVSSVEYTSLFVNTNGMISFNGSVSQYTPASFPLGNGDRRVMVAPFWTDVDTGKGGEIWYGEVTSPDILQRATQDVRDAFPDLKGFTANWTFVTTWNRVAAYGGGVQDNGNTFQAILITDGQYSFARFIYQEIIWTETTTSGGRQAECGFNSGDGNFSFSITRSINSSLYDLPYTTNLKTPKSGVWMFRLDEDEIEPSGAITGAGHKVTCGNTYMDVQIPKSKYQNINWQNFHLEDVNCRAVRETLYWIHLRAPLHSCGTNYSSTNNILTFGNVVKIDNRYANPDSSVITRQQITVMRFHCQYSRRQLVSTSFSPAKEIVHVSEGGFGNFTFTMRMFKSSTYSSMYQPFEYPVRVSLNEPLWIQFQVTTSARLVVFAERCYATNSANSNSNLKYKFLENGCALDATMVYKYNRLSSTQRFSIKSFRFVQDSSLLIYIHCELMVCHLSSNNSRCARGCTNSVGVRRRRDTQQYADTSKEHELSTGPVQLALNKTSNQDAQNGEGVQGMVIGIGVLGAVLFAVCTVLVVRMVLKLYKTRRVKPEPNANFDDESAAAHPDAKSNEVKAGELKV